MIEITMPRLSDTMEEGAIAAWQVQPGDRVSPGDVLAEIETDKAVMDFEAYDSGTITELLVEPGSVVSIGQPIALLDDGSGEALAPTGPAANRADRAGGSQPTPDNRRPHAVPAGPVLASPLVRRIARENDLDLRRIAGSGPGGRIIRLDVERALADQNRPFQTAHSKAGCGPDAPLGAVPPARWPSATQAPAQVSGLASAGGPAAFEGPGAAGASDHIGGVTPPGGSAAPGGSSAAESSAQKGGLAPAGGSATFGGSGPAGGLSAAGGTASGNGGADGTPTGDDPREPVAVPVAQLRRVIARRLTQSAQEIPSFTVTQAVQADALVELRAQLNRHLAATGRGKVSVNDLIVKAAGLGLREHPAVNASWGQEQLLLHGRVNVGIAVATDRGLMVPVIKDADAKTPVQIGAESRSLAGLAAEAKLAPDQMSGGTFTVSNLGMYGVEEFTAIINPPEVAILAVGAARPELALAGADVVTRQVMRLTVTCDHRAIDGALAAQFLSTVRALLENPWSLLA
ncbi:MAG: 2-oxo acid dehydrogenase subunit E2 [Bifidobacteriaceae bacterium]|jgi:pyruvate dehydrogenase E2 component (dihydrolipoamide acetyltransferase)|nr:2-oxo acid dehydrogenase subunit E2 [Bifidobacteriaceae bacterium]